ncbi:hypothetical protein KAR91_71465 [Candidatus Pacearchaeota archaeon]|nr:hypothetical protein [Candidatus Pacearchaeota archaeon]
MAMTFRPSKEALKSIEQIKQDLNIATNSKVIEYALEQFPIVLNELKSVYSELEDTTDDLRNMNDIILDKFKSDQEYNNMVNNLVSK